MILADELGGNWLALDKLDTSSGSNFIEAMANIRCIQATAQDPYNGITLVELCDSDVELYDDGRIVFCVECVSFADAILIRSGSHETILINDATPSVYLKKAEYKLESEPVLDVQFVVEAKEELLRKYWDDQLKDKLIKFMEKTYRNIGNFIDHKQAVGVNIDRVMFATLQQVLLKSNIEPAYFVDGAYIQLSKIAESYMCAFLGTIRRIYKSRWAGRMAPMRRRMIPLPGFDSGGKVGKRTKLFPSSKMHKMAVLWR